MVYKMLILAVYGFGVCFPPQDPSRPTRPLSEEIRKRVDDIVDRHFNEVDPSIRKVYSNKLFTSLVEGRSPKQITSVLDDLSSAAKYHVGVVQQYTEDTDTSKPEIAKLIQEGYDLQVEYLTARVSRALKAELSEVDRALVLEQIGKLISAAKEALKEKLLGDAAAKRVDERMNYLQKAWAGSLESPLQRTLDRPLSSAELETVLSGIRENTKSFTPVTLTEDDFSNQSRFQSLHIGKLFEDVTNGIYRAGQICFSNYRDLQTRTDQWRVRIQKMTR